MSGLTLFNDATNTSGGNYQNTVQQVNADLSALVQQVGMCTSNAVSWNSYVNCLQNAINPNQNYFNSQNSGFTGPGQYYSTYYQSQYPWLN